MKIYQVGGSIRDELLGIKALDRDFVVVGSNEKEMLKRGFYKVGSNFPVFISYATDEEYALARREKKSGNGYLGFETTTENVTLEEDLKRRDLTINSIAKDSDGKIIDPFGGAEDIKNRVLRHTSLAFREDAVRVLRLARFKTRFPDFKIADETIKLVKKMVADGELKELKNDRVFLELRKSLKLKNSILFFQTLKELNAYDDLFSFIDLDSIDIQKLELMPDVESKFAFILKDVENPKDFMTISKNTVALSKYIREHLYRVENFFSITPEERLKLFNATRNYHQLERLKDFHSDMSKIIKIYNRYKSVSKELKNNKSMSGEEIKQFLKNRRVKLLSEDI